MVQCNAVLWISGVEWGCQQFGPINTAVLTSVAPFCSAAVLIGPNNWHPSPIQCQFYTLMFYKAKQQCYTWLHLTTAVLYSSPLHQAWVQIDQMTEQRWIHSWFFFLHQYVLQYKVYSGNWVNSESTLHSSQPSLPTLSALYLFQFPVCTLQLLGAIPFPGLWSFKTFILSS